MSGNVAAGFQITPGVLAREEVAAIGETLEASELVRSRAGSRHLMRNAAVAAVAQDARMLALAQHFLDAPPLPFRATLFDKSSGGNWLVVWHQDTALPLSAQRDTPGWGPWSVKGGVIYAHAPAHALSRVIALRLHLDDSRTDNGPLRVLPATHARGVLTDAEIARLSEHRAAVDCVVSAGGVVAMRPLLLHASSKAESGHRRRVLHIEYIDSLTMAPGLQLAIA